MKKLLNICFVFLAVSGFSQNYVQVQGNKVLHNGEEFNIRSVTVAQEDALKDLDFERLKSWKTNTIRIVFDATLLEANENPNQYLPKGFKWLDKYIEQAKAFDLKVILAMNTPPGGLRPSDNRAYMWTNVGFRDRFRNMWVAIAEKYANESTVLGYELLVDPQASYRVQWKEVASVVVAQIRNKDKNHVIIFNRIDGAKTKYGNDEDMNFAKLNDENVIYGFRFYTPTTFTSQNAPGGMKEAGKYPDEKKTEYPDDLATAFSFIPETKIINGTRDWYLHATEKYQYHDTTTISAMPVFVCNKMGNIGHVALSNLFVREYSPSGDFVQDALIVNMADYEYSWQFNSSDGQGRIELDANYGMEGTPTLLVMYVESDSKTYNNLIRFKPKFGHFYTVESYVRPQKLKQEADCYFRLDFEKSSSNSKPQVRNKQYLASTFTQIIAFGEKNNVPMMVTEFGTSVETLKKNKGGDVWIKEVSDLCEQNNLHWSYYKYTGKFYSLYPKDKSRAKQEPFQGASPVIMGE